MLVSVVVVIVARFGAGLEHGGNLRPSTVQLQSIDSSNSDITSATWVLPLLFKENTSFQRTFTVDAPEACGHGPCPDSHGQLPILVDFHGYGMDAPSEREWTEWPKYVKKTKTGFILVTPDGSDDASANPRSQRRFQGWNVLGWGTPSSPVLLNTGGSTVERACEQGTSCLDWAELYCCYESQRQLDANACAELPRTSAATHKGLAASSLIEAPQNGRLGANRLQIRDWFGRGGGGISTRKVHLPRKQQSFLQSWQYRSGESSEELQSRHTTHNGYSSSTAKMRRVRLRRMVAAKDRAAAAEAANKCKRWSTTCATSSAQDDGKFVSHMLRFVVNQYRGDAKRIYFFGQSEGGMAALQFAVPGVLPPDLRPAAVVASSSAAARGNTAKLQGNTPTLLLHGFRDNIVPATPWIGSANDGVPMSRHDAFKQAVKNPKLLKRASSALRETSRSESVKADDTLEERWTAWPWDITHEKPSVRLLLKADIQSGGSLLGPAFLALSSNVSVGCNEPTLEKGVALGQLSDEVAGSALVQGSVSEQLATEKVKKMATVSSDGYLYDNVGTTLTGIAGHQVDMARLHFIRISEASSDTDVDCASVPSASNAEIQFCTFDGWHCLPWQDDNCGWVRGSQDAKSFHDFVWNDFLKEGRMLRNS